MAHPMASQAKASQKARLRRLQGTPGKAWGSTSMYKKSSLPKKNAGSSTPMTISGGSAKKRPDRFAFGGSVGDKKKRKSGNTTNIIISHAGGRGGSGGGGGGGARPPVPGVAPVPVPRPVPVPVGGVPAGPGPGLPGAAPVVRPPVAPVGAAPVAPVARPPLPGGPPPVGVRPPGMKAGGVVKKKIGGDVPGKGYKGYPHSPTTKVDDAVSPHKAGGTVKLKNGGSAEGVAVEGKGHGLPGGGKSAEGVAVEGKAHGLKDGGPAQGPGGFRNRQGNMKAVGEKKTYGENHIKKRNSGGGITVTKKLQIGGGANLGGSPMGGGGLGGAGQGNVGSPGGSGLLGLFPGRQPVGPQQGATNLSGRQAIPFSQPVTVPMGRMATSALTRPAPGTTTTYAKRGGKIPHDDEAEDKRMIKGMVKKGALKRKEGGFVPKNQESKDPGLEGTIYRNQGKGYKDGGSIGGISNATGGAGGGLGRLAKSRAAK